MRTVERFAFFFGIANLILGILSAITSYRANRRRNILDRMLPMRRSGFFNRGAPMVGNFGAVNTPHAVMHSVLGAAGLASRPFSRMSRAYMWMNAVMFGALAVLGWASFGFKPGVHRVKGIALDVSDNILHTLWAAGSLLLAIKPNLGQSVDRSVNDMVEAGLRE